MRWSPQESGIRFLRGALPGVEPRPAEALLFQRGQLFPERREIGHAARRAVVALVLERRHGRCGRAGFLLKYSDNIGLMRLDPCEKPVRRLGFGFERQLAAVKAEAYSVFKGFVHDFAGVHISTSQSSLAVPLEPSLTAPFSPQMGLFPPAFPSLSPDWGGSTVTL